MSAAATDHFKEATNGTRPSPTTLTAIHTNGQTTMTVNSLTGWPTATGVGFIIYNIDSTGAKIAGSQTDWSGVGNGTTSITGCILKAGTDSGYSVGAVVECAPTAAWADDLIDGLLIQHTQLGAHTGVTTDTLTATGVVNTSTVSSLQDTSVALSTYRKETQTPFVASGGVWTGDALGSTKAASMTAMVCYINGRRISIGAVTARTFTASKDTYVDVLDNADGTGTLVYTEVTNNAASPALAANSLRIAIVVTGASNIAAAGSINQGDPACVLPIVSSIAYSVTDSLGNLICNRNPNPTVIGYRQILTEFDITSATVTQATGLSVPVIIPSNRRVRITVSGDSLANSTSGGTTILSIWDGVVVSGTQLAQISAVSASANYQLPLFAASNVTASGSKTYNVGVKSAGGGTAKLVCSSTAPAYITVELMT